MFEAGISCSRCYESLTEEKLNAARERQRQVELARQRGVKHLGAKLDKCK
jgi:UPF0176 protein